MPKRKLDRSADSAVTKHSSPICILHLPSISDHGPFIPLSKIKGAATEKLEQLHNIRDRRLHQSFESPYRMQAVCDKIPTTVPADLENVGYHHQCYQRFTGNLHRLGDDTEPEATTSQRHHSPRRSSTGSDGAIFPPECIFCEKVQIKSGDGKTERAESFSSWKNKHNAWQQIESRSEKMGLVRLNRLVKDKDLFAVEAKHHPSCWISFRTAFANYERGVQRAEAAKNTEQVRVLAAHEMALVSVLEHLQTHVIQQNEVLRLSSLRLLYVTELKLNGYENLDYRSEKLLKRLQNDPIKDHVCFTKVHSETPGAISFWLVYRANITVSDALARAYSLGRRTRN